VRIKQWIWLYEVFLFILKRDFEHAVKFYAMGLTALLLRRKAYCGFLSPLNIHHFQTGLNPRTLDPMASTLATTTPRATR
jgi:hypothetical protein